MLQVLLQEIYILKKLENQDKSEILKRFEELSLKLV